MHAGIDMATKTISPKAVVLIFLLCAVADFLWGYFNGHTFGAAVTAAILGLCGTAFYLVLFHGKDEIE
jgi:membrane associated rhomboid family serine protease